MRVYFTHLKSFLGIMEFELRVDIWETQLPKICLLCEIEEFIDSFTSVFDIKQ